MEDGKSLVVREETSVAFVANQTKAAINSGIRSVARAAVSQVEDLPVGQIRQVLDAVCAGHPFAMRTMVETSLTFNSDDEYSAIVEAMEPDEIQHIMEISENIFSQDSFHVISPLDHHDDALWIPITEEEKEAIDRSEDANLQSRVRSINPVSSSVKVEGPWAIFHKKTAVDKESIISYVSAVVNARRSNDWKEDMLRAIGLEVLAFVFHHDDEIRARVQKISPKFEIEVKAFLENNQHDLEVLIAQRHEDALDDMGMADTVLPEEEQSTESLLGELSELEALAGGDVQEAEIASSDIDDALSAAFQKGIPNE